jgi:hypothetical protein
VKTNCIDCQQWNRHGNPTAVYGTCLRYGHNVRRDQFCDNGEPLEVRPAAGVATSKRGDTPIQRQPGEIEKESTQ